MAPGLPLHLDQTVAAIGRAMEGYPEIAAAWLFGSFARGTARDDSDVDIGVVFRRRGDTALDHHSRMRTLAARLETVCGGRRIDLVALESQGPIFCHRVLREGRRVHDADRERRIDFESTTYVRYLDFLPTWQIAGRVPQLARGAPMTFDGIAAKIVVRGLLSRVVQLDGHSVPQLVHRMVRAERRELEATLDRR